MKRSKLLTAMFLIGCSAKHDIALITSSRSPDGINTAVAYSDMGGGAAGWCYICIDVVSATFNKGKARCTKEQQWFRCSSDVKLEWQTAQTVVVSYKGQPATEPVTESQAAASTPAVSIIYRKGE